MERETQRTGAVIGWATYGSIATGVLAVLAAVLAYGDWAGVGVCLMAAALAFGLLANAVLRQ